MSPLADAEASIREAEGGKKKQKEKKRKQKEGIEHCESVSLARAIAAIVIAQ